MRLVQVQRRGKCEEQWGSSSDGHCDTLYLTLVHCALCDA